MTPCQPFFIITIVNEMDTDMIYFDETNPNREEMFSFVKEKTVGFDRDQLMDFFTCGDGKCPFGTTEREIYACQRDCGADPNICYECRDIQDELGVL